MTGVDRYHDEMLFDDDDDLDEEECGRWFDGRLSSQCSLAGTEWCDWECPIGLGMRRTKR